MTPAQLGLALVALLLWLAPRAAALQHTQSAGPARLEIHADGPDDSLALSDVLTATLSVEGGPELRVEGPRGDWAPSGWTLLQRGKPTRAEFAPGRLRWQETYVLAPQAPGTWTLQFPPLRYGAGQSATWQPLRIHVTSQVDAGAPGKLRDFADVEEVPPSPRPASPPWLLALPLLILTSLGLYLYFRKATAPSARQPAHAALRACQRLVASKLLEEGRGERFVTLLTTILRRYLARQFQLPARRQTTAEFTPALAACARLTAEQKKFLQATLGRCDLIKFARVSPAAEECRALAEEVRRFIEATALSRVDRRENAG
jgi:hypothetical protein